MSQNRYFKVAAGRVVIPPRGLLTGPGATHLRFGEGDVLELEAGKVDRFIRGRVRAGDLVEVKDPGPPPAAPKSKEPRPAGAAELDLAAGHRKKEG
jgi:hypothetical protein